MLSMEQCDLTTLVMRSAVRFLLMALMLLGRSCPWLSTTAALSKRELVIATLNCEGVRRCGDGVSSGR